MNNRNKIGRFADEKNALIICFSVIITSFLLSGCGTSNKLTDRDESIEVGKIWDKARHNAFTDLIRFNNEFYCALREAPAHVSGPNGTVRIIKSTDGDQWKSVATFSIDTRDVRDPKLSITPDHRLIVLMDVESYKKGKVVKRQPYVSYSNESGTRFSEPERSDLDPVVSSWSSWVWRLTWHDGTGYAVVYQPGGIYLLKTKGGSQFENVSRINIDGSPNESTIRFDKEGKMYVLIRREAGDKMGVLATSAAPYHDWEFHKLDIRLGGPDFLFLSDSTLCIGSRLYPGADHKNYATAIFLADPNGNIYKTLTLPSRGDTGYPGMVRYGGKLWFSYYSSEAGSTSVYLAKVPLDKLVGEF